MGALFKMFLGTATSALGGIWGYITVFVLGGAIATGVTYTFVHNADAYLLAQQQAAFSDYKAASNAAALDQLTHFIGTMHAATTSYDTALADINAKFSAIEKGLTANAFKTPLPVDCKPDANRVRSLKAAIGAANNHTAP